MRTINPATIIRPLADAIIYSLNHVEQTVVDLLKCKLPTQNGSSKWALEQIIDNDEYAAGENIPACQDTGLAVFFVEIGNDIHIDGDLTQGINSAVALAYAEGYARKSVVKSPLERINTGDNTPAIIHYNLTVGDTLKISYLAKGAGSENMSALHMLTPSKGRLGIINAVVDTVKSAGANPCPPIIVGVGIGGNAEYSSILAKKSLLRNTGTPSKFEDVAMLERDILTTVNALGIGIQGFGGDLTALAVHCETAATHIGMLPVSVCLQCHSVRHCQLEF